MDPNHKPLDYIALCCIDEFAKYIEMAINPIYSFGKLSMQVEDYDIEATLQRKFRKITFKQGEESVIEKYPCNCKMTVHEGCVALTITLRDTFETFTFTAKTI